jgi:hypothetical protein
MSDESSDNEQSWWMPADQPDPADRDELTDQPGWPHWMRTTRPIGPMGLRSRTRRPYILAGVAVAALLGGAGAALASTTSGTPAAPSSVAATPAPSPGQPGSGSGSTHHFGGRFFGGGLFGALHGQFVVAKPGGGYQTVDLQSGQVTAVSSSSITVKSSDGFTRSYTVTGSTIVDAQRDGIGSVKVGNQATVLATVSGSAATATSIEDMTLLQQGHSAFGSGPGAPPGPSNPQAG